MWMNPWLHIGMDEGLWKFLFLFWCSLLLVYFTFSFILNKDNKSHLGSNKKINPNSLQDSTPKKKKNKWQGDQGIELSDNVLTVAHSQTP